MSQKQKADIPFDPTISTREKAILAGLFLSRFDSLALRTLGFDSFTEAFNVIGYALGSRPASIKNYRDEFDPLFENQRRGWHNRPIRPYCKEVYEKYEKLGLQTFSVLLRSFFGTGLDDLNISGNSEASDPTSKAFSQRLITGLAAERYFESRYSSLVEFNGRAIENVTQYGCGYDYRLCGGATENDFWAVEVKGLQNSTGTISMTTKEFETARALQERFYLFIVRNFREIPSHSIYRNPLSTEMVFRRTERVIVQVSWAATV